MSTPDISKPLSNIVRTLCNPRSRDIDKRRRLFQLKTWLVDDRANDHIVFSEADRLFAALGLTMSIFEQMEEARDERESTLPSVAIEVLLRDDKDFRAMVDRGFSTSRGFASLSDLDVLAAKARNGQLRRKVESVNEHTRLCMRAHLAKRKDVMQTADTLYEFAAAQPHSKLNREISALRTARRRRLSFLAVAQITKRLLDFPASPLAMWSLLSSQSDDTKFFQIFFSRCAMVQGIVARGSECKKADIERWSGHSAAEAPAKMEPVSDEELEAAKAFLIAQEG